MSCKCSNLLTDNHKWCMQVPRELLKVWAIVQAQGTLSGVTLPAGIQSTMVQTFSLQPRTDSSPTAFEHMAVQQACQQLLSNVSTLPLLTGACCAAHHAFMGRTHNVLQIIRHSMLIMLLQCTTAKSWDAQKCAIGKTALPYAR